MDIFLGSLFLIICFLLIIVVLLQKGKGGGLGAAFGGAGSSAFGTKTGDVFTWVTIVLTGLFLLLAVLSSLVFRPDSGKLLAPEFLPEPSPITEPKNVTIASESLGAHIVYTHDGSVPTENAEGSLEYNQPVRVEPGTTLKARAFRKGWDPSDVATAVYAKAVATQPGAPPGTPALETMPGSPTPAPTPAPRGP